MIHDFDIRVFVFSYFSSLAEFFQVFFFASSVKTRVYISVFANHPVNKVLGTLAVVHSVYFSCLVVSNALTDFGVQSCAVHVGVVILNRHKTVTAVSS